MAKHSTTTTSTKGRKASTSAAGTTAAAVTAAPVVPAAAAATVAMPTSMPRASRATCSAAVAGLHAAAAAAGPAAGLRCVALGHNVYAPKGGQANGLRQSLMLAVAQALTGGPVPLATFSATPFAYSTRNGQATGLLGAHMPFMLGNGYITVG